MILKLDVKPLVSCTRAERIVNAWNFLPDIVDFSSLSRFKRSVHQVDFSRLLKCFMICILAYICTFGILFAFVCVFLKATITACHANTGPSPNSVIMQ